MHGLTISVPATMLTKITGLNFMLSVHRSVTDKILTDKTLLPTTALMQSQFPAMIQEPFKNSLNLHPADIIMKTGIRLILHIPVNNSGTVQLMTATVPITLMKRNYYNKPLVNLNWYSQLTKEMSLYSTVYYSGGTGGGSGTYGNMRWINPPGNGSIVVPSRVVDWNGTIAKNEGSRFGSLGILANSVNNQWTVGALSKGYYKFQMLSKLHSE